MSDPTRIRGYHELTPTEVSVVNATKHMEELVAEHWKHVCAQPGIDQRWAAVSRTHLQEGFTALVRSITQPDDPFGR